MIHSVNDLIATASEARRRMSLDSAKKAESLRKAIDNELYMQALKGQNKCMIDVNQYKDSDDPCGYIINHLIEILEQEGFRVRYMEFSELLTIEW
jgi:hypothetical protein